MNRLQSAKELAQRYANRERKPFIVLNLNPYSPLYVVRDYDDRLLDSKGFVALVEPMEPAQ